MLHHTINKNTTLYCDDRMAMQYIEEAMCILKICYGKCFEDIINLKNEIRMLH